MNANCFPQPPADSVSCHRVSCFFRNREAKAWRTAISAVANLEQKQRSAPLFAFAYGKKLGPLAQFARETAFCRLGQFTGLRLDQALSRLRPRARRAAMTLRPPVVAIRERKP